METLSFYLKGKETDAFDFADMAEFTASLSEALRRVHRVIEPGTGKLPRYEIAKVELASFSSILRATGSGIIAASAFVASLSAIKYDRPLPLNLSGDDIRAIRELTNTLDSKTAFIEIADILIDKEFRANCDRILASAPKSLGQVVGRIDGLNTHIEGGWYFRLYPTGVNRGAECFFDESDYSKIHKAMRGRVRVEGLIHRNPDGVGIDRITNLTVIEPIPEDNDLPTLRSLFGSFADSPIDISAGWDR